MDLTSRGALALGRGSRDYPVADRFRDSLRPIAHAESAAGVHDIVIDGSFREAERVTDFSRGFPTRNAGEAFELSGGERRGGRSTISQVRLRRAACGLDPWRSFPVSSSQPAWAGFSFAALGTLLGSRSKRSQPARTVEDNLAYMLLLNGRLQQRRPFDTFSSGRFARQLQGYLKASGSSGARRSRSRRLNSGTWQAQR
jgi:hypothetical protein